MVEEQPRGLHTTPHSTRLRSRRRRKRRKVSLKIFSDGSFMGRKLVGATTLGFLINASPSSPPPPSTPPSSPSSPTPQLHHLSSLHQNAVFYERACETFPLKCPQSWLHRSTLCCPVIGHRQPLARGCMQWEAFFCGSPETKHRPRGPAPPWTSPRLLSVPTYVCICTLSLNSAHFCFSVQ